MLRLGTAGAWLAARPTATVVAMVDEEASSAGAPRRPRRALVCGGGGVAGLAWMVGFLHGAVSTGLDLAGSDLVVGTSAGTVAGALLATSGVSAAFARLTGNAPLPFEAEPPRDAFTAAVPRIVPLAGTGRYVAEFMALALSVPAEMTVMAERRRTMVERAGTGSWPQSRLLVTVLSERAGGRRVLTSDSGVDLVTALTASCAVPGMWPAVPLPDGDVCADAGVLSATHADLAADYDPVIVLRPVPNLQGNLAAEDDVLRRALIVEPVTDLSQGPAHTDPRPQAARLGYAQAIKAATTLHSAWSSPEHPSAPSGDGGRP